MIKILEENIKRYLQLKTLIETAKDTKDYLHAINMGIDNSMGLLESLPIKDEKILEEIRDFRDSFNKVSELYGKVPRSELSAMQLLHDQTIAESFRMVKSFKDYSERQEENSQRIAMQSREASLKGASRMQAETSSQILRSLSQLIRLNTQVLKLQSEQFAAMNRSNKENVSSFQRVNSDFGKSFQNFPSDMSLARF